MLIMPDLFTKERIEKLSREDVNQLALTLAEALKMSCEMMLKLQSKNGSYVIDFDELVECKILTLIRTVEREHRQQLTIEDLTKSYVSYQKPAVGDRVRILRGLRAAPYLLVNEDMLKYEGKETYITEVIDYSAILPDSYKVKLDIDKGKNLWYLSTITKIWPNKGGTHEKKTVQENL